ncbi:putative baseplate assembly protein [Paucibacter sp. KBW04]|uniref:putative baseplate assembly protein n=1 Tax=Paucibacter sp. KBW04 TaxID=2153361 RepID=UPI000F56ADF8|nr:putative baseplate assembly protein [Paucibacter sp. KBW04]RQO54777.1 putative baseplate assembly protein [Paucibacter sp. KBW04]
MSLSNPAAATGYRPPGSQDCGACSGLQLQTPQAHTNRQGLSDLRYRVGDYASVRASLLTQLSSSQFPALAALKSRDSDDFTLALLDAFACSADVLSFYQERIANESFLRTATERVSLQEMAKLIGYTLRPGVAAETWLAFALETPPAPPPNLPPEPGNFVTGVPQVLSLASGLKVQSLAGPGEQAQTFETVEPLAEARPEWNALRPWLSEPITPQRYATETYIAGVRNNLKAGDALLLVGAEFASKPASNAWDLRFLDEVELQAAQDRTRLRWLRGLGSIAPPSNPAAAPSLYVLRRRSAVFGHNAPSWLAMPLSYRDNYPQGLVDGNRASEWPGFTLSPAGASHSGGHVDLESLAPEISKGSFAVLAKGSVNYAAEPAPPGSYLELYRVQSTAEVSRAEFGLSGKLSRLHLQGDSYASEFQDRVRETSVFAHSEPLQLAPYPVDTVVSGARIPVLLSAQGLLPGRRLLLRGQRVSDGITVSLQATLVALHRLDAERCELEISPALAEPLQRDSLVVWANVVLASQGETVAEVLGSGQGHLSHQRFELKQTPLCYRAADQELGAAAQLSLQVGELLWQERPSLFDAGPNEPVFALSIDEQGRRFAQFGDGIHGARLPSGVNNIRARYRKGLGAAGNVRADTLTQLLSRPLGLKSVSNPLAAQGGNDAEAAETARQNMPLATRTLGRVVSVQDYEDFARAFSGIAKAQARVMQLGPRRLIALTLAAPGGAAIGPASPVWQNLQAALLRSGDPLVQVQLLSAQLSTFRLALRVKVEADRVPAQVLAAVEAELRTRYAFEARELGQPVQQSELIQRVQALPGVQAVDLRLLYGGSQPLAQTLASKQERLLAAAMRVQGQVLLAAELLTLTAGPLDELSEMNPS